MPNTTIIGVVKEGKKLGTELGFPTANIAIDNLVKIENGVYAIRIHLDGFNYKGMANIGYRPTVDNGTERLLEVHIFDYSGQLYGKRIAVTLCHYLRDEKKFASTDELVDAMKEDERKARALLI